MKPHSHKRYHFIWILLALLLLLMAGCSKTKIAYHFSDWFLLRTLDKYFDVNATQHDFLEEKIDILFVWHWKNELPDIVVTLKELNTRIASGLKKEDILWLQEDHRNFFKRFFIHFSPDFADFLTTLEPGQIAHLQTQFEEGNAYLIEQLAMTDAEMLTDAQDWLLKITAKWVGPLDDTQKKRVRSGFTLKRSWIKKRLKNRRRFHQTFVALLEAKKTAAEVNAQLIEWTQKPETRWSPEFTQQVRQRSAAWNEILVKIDAMLTPLQRTHLLGKIQDHIEDFEDLAGNNTSPAES